MAGAAVTNDTKNDATTEAPDELDALEERRAKRLAERERAERKQRVVDLTARERLEDEHDRVAAVRVPYRPGQPTEAYVRTPTPAEVDTYDDHRMAMSFSLAGLRCGATIRGAECVSKSYPAFFEDLGKLLSASARD